MDLSQLKELIYNGSSEDPNRDVNKLLEYASTVRNDLRKKIDKGDFELEDSTRLLIEYSESEMILAQRKSALNRTGSNIQRLQQVAAWQSRKDYAKDALDFAISEHYRLLNEKDNSLNAEERVKAIESWDMIKTNLQNQRDTLEIVPGFIGDSSEDRYINIPSLGGYVKQSTQTNAQRNSGGLN
jgi:hypothetical protein